MALEAEGVSVRPVIGASRAGVLPHQVPEARLEELPEVAAAHVAVALVAEDSLKNTRTGK